VLLTAGNTGRAIRRSGRAVAAGLDRRRLSDAGVGAGVPLPAG
jgi:hypothetical protein